MTRAKKKTVDALLRNSRQTKQLRLDKELERSKEDLPDLKAILRGIESTSIFVIVNEALLKGDSSPSARSKD